MRRTILSCQEKDCAHDCLFATCRLRSLSRSSWAFSFGKNCLYREVQAVPHFTTRENTRQDPTLSVHLYGQNTRSHYYFVQKSKQIKLNSKPNRKAAIAITTRKAMDAPNTNSFPISPITLNAFITAPPSLSLFEIDINPEIID